MIQSPRESLATVNSAQTVLDPPAGGLSRFLGRWIDTIAEEAGRFSTAIFSASAGASLGELVR